MKVRQHSSIWLAAIMAMTAFALTACNTVRGVGKDLQAGGRAIENVAAKD